MPIGFIDVILTMKLSSMPKQSKISNDLKPVIVKKNEAACFYSSRRIKLASSPAIFFVFGDVFESETLNFFRNRRLDNSLKSLSKKVLFLVPNSNIKCADNCSCLKSFSQTLNVHATFGLTN